MDVRAAQRTAELVALAELEAGAELREGVDVRVEPAPPDHVPAGRRDARAAEPCE